MSTPASISVAAYRGKRRTLPITFKRQDDTDLDMSAWTSVTVRLRREAGKSAALTLVEDDPEITRTASQWLIALDDPSRPYASLPAAKYRIEIDAVRPGAVAPESIVVGTFNLLAEGAAAVDLEDGATATWIDGEETFAVTFDGATEALTVAAALLASLSVPSTARLVSAAFAGLAAPYFDDVGEAVTDALAAVAAGATIEDVYLLDAGAALPAGETWQTLRSAGVRVHTASDVDRTHALEMLLLQGTYDEAIAPFALDESTLQLSITL